MSLPKCMDFTDYNRYPGEENPTTDAQMQEFMLNQNLLVKAAAAKMWQPSTEYATGDIVTSPSMPAGTEAVCMGAGMSDSVLEPSWTMGSNIPDGSCFWKLRYVHYTSFLATEEEAAAGTDTEKIMTPAAVKAAVGSMNAASATKLEVPRNINEVAFDGTADITIDTGVKTINGSAPDAAGNLDIASLPVGHEYFSLNPNLPTGSLPLTGGIYSREAYRDLWAWVQTQTGYLIAEDEWQLLSKKNNGSVPFYSSGDGSATFRVPSLACWIRGANGIEEVGSYLKAGLPNIEGTWKQALCKEYTVTEGTGALQAWASGTTVNSATGSGWEGGGILLDASLSNDIYGASDTVQPPSVIGIWLVKAFGTVDITGSQDLSDISAGLAIAESRIGQLENGVPSDYIVESYRNGTDWYEVYKSGKIRQGGIWKGSLSAPLDRAVAINVTFLKPFANTNYYASVMHRTQHTVFGGGMAAASEDASGKTTTSCKFYYTGYYAVRTITEACWVAEGQGA